MITRALVLVGAELLASALVLAALTDWTLSMWSDAITSVTSLPVKGTALFAVPALYFALVTSNALDRATPAATPALRWVAAIAAIMSIGSALLFWALPLWLTD